MKISLSSEVEKEGTASKSPSTILFESAFFEWDNTPRYKDRAKIFTGLSNEEMKDLI